MSALITCNHVDFGYENHDAVVDLTMEVDSGDYLCVVGENGSGKSTLMKGLLGLIKPTAGTLTVAEELKKTGIGYLPQQTAAQRDFPATVYEVVISGCLSRRGHRPFYSMVEKKMARTSMEKLGITVPAVEGVGTIVHVAVEGSYAGYLLIADVVKPHSADAIRALKASGVRKTVMLTGDADAVGKKVAGQLHLDQVYTELLPADKVDRVESLLKQKSEKGMLAFVGDGINDAPVLARADVGIAMGGLGSDAAIEAADVVLMTDEPSKIAAVMKIARKTIRIANQNIVFALGVKFLVLILGALGYANMWAAVFADVGVSIIAILNAIRAMRVKLPDMPAGSTNQG